MSSRGWIALDTKTLAGATQLIPVAWLAFLSKSDLPQLATKDPLSIDREHAVRNFDENSAFFATLIGDQLEFRLAQRLAKPIRGSTAGQFVIDIGDMLPLDNEICVLEELFSAIENKDHNRQCKLKRRKCQVTGNMLPSFHFANTLSMLYTVCWITPRMLQIATRKEREMLVTGVIVK